MIASNLSGLKHSTIDEKVEAMPEAAAASENGRLHSLNLFEQFVIDRDLIPAIIT
jgi:hypothetical protein